MQVPPVGGSSSSYSLPDPKLGPLLVTAQKLSGEINAMYNPTINLHANAHARATLHEVRKELAALPPNDPVAQKWKQYFSDSFFSGDNTWPNFDGNLDDFNAKVKEFIGDIAKDIGGSK